VSADDESRAMERPTLASPRVARVGIEEPGFGAADYVWWASVGALTLLGQASLVLFLAYFLLVYDDLFKRKLVENIGPRLSQKKITVQIRNDIAVQIERSLLVHILTSVLVGAATGVALWAIGLKHPWVWAIAAGVFNAVPYFGPLLVAAGLGIVGYLQYESLQAALGIAGLAMAITTIEGYWVTPTLMRRVAEINRMRSLPASCSGAGCGAFPACCSRFR
jgi:predicted PurR-regulated permease PerM